MSQNVEIGQITNKKAVNHEISSKSEDQSEREEDYSFLVRNPEVSLKYFFTLAGKTINLLNSEHPNDSIRNIPIVCSYADMEFKLSPEIQKDWVKRISDPNLIVGYAFHPTTRQMIVQRLKQTTNYEAKKGELILINSMLTLYYLAMTQLTKQGDQVLIFTPTYYRFLFTLNDEKRQIVEYELKTRQNLSEETEFYIDFDELSKLFETNKIKMMVFANPHNPTGKIWSKQELTQLKDLCLKFDCLVFSDDIFYDCVQNPKRDYCSFLQFPDIHQNLIWASAFGKAFNCSGNSFTYGVVQNRQIREKLANAVMRMNLYPTFAACQLLESCYSVGDGWRLRTIKFIQENYQVLKQEITKRNLKLDLYVLESAFLPVIDFAKYKWPHSEIKSRLQSQNIFPTYLDTCYVNRQKESVTCVRLNLAMSRDILYEFIDRLQKALLN